MSVANFIPAVWDNRLLKNLEKSLIFAQPGVVNRDYEGNIATLGDKVKINSIGPVTVKSYTRNTDIADPDQLQSAQQELVIDTAEYFNFFVDDVDKAQSNVTIMDKAMERAAYALKDAVDTFIAGKYVDASTANFVGSDGSPKTFSAATDAYGYLVDLSVALDVANVPSDGRWVIIPPWFAGLLVKDTNFIHATAMGDAILRNGQIGEAAGFAVMKSNNVHSATTTYHIMAGNEMAISYASQVEKTEAYRPEKKFADAVKGLHVYGGKVVYPDALAVLVATKP